jgi:hypothetical protein
MQTSVLFCFVFYPFKFVGNPQEDLAKSERKVKQFRNHGNMLQPIFSKYGDFRFVFPHSVVTVSHFFPNKTFELVVARAFFFSCTLWNFAQKNSLMQSSPFFSVQFLFL